MGLNTEALAEKILKTIEDDDPSVTERGHTIMTITRRWRVIRDIKEVLDNELT